MIIFSAIGFSSIFFANVQYAEIFYLLTLSPLSFVQYNPRKCCCTQRETFY